MTRKPLLILSTKLLVHNYTYKVCMELFPQNLSFHGLVVRTMDFLTGVTSMSLDSFEIQAINLEWHRYSTLPQNYPTIFHYLFIFHRVFIFHSICYSISDLIIIVLDIIAQNWRFYVIWTHEGSAPLSINFESATGIEP